MTTKVYYNSEKLSYSSRKLKKSELYLFTLKKQVLIQRKYYHNLNRAYTNSVDSIIVLWKFLFNFVGNFVRFETYGFTS